MSGMKLGVALLAAGMGSRFGGNKLLAGYRGQPLICRAMETLCALPAARRVAVVSDERVTALAQTYGFELVFNDAPQLGQGRSVALAISALLDMDAVLLMLGDQPRVSGESLLRLAGAFEQSGKGLACLSDETHAGNPAVFSRRYFDRLMALAGDRGAKGILRQNPDDLVVVPCAHPYELTDADTPQALAAMESE